jgi:hypothetical protein
VEFMYGGGKFIYHVKGINFDAITGQNMVYAEAIFINPMPDGTQVVIKDNSFNYSVSPIQFSVLSSLQSLPDSTILKTMFMHLVNGLLARIPELGGTPYGGGMEYFNNDGSITQPLITYKLVQVNGAYDLVIDQVEPSDNWKLFVNGNEWLVDTEVNNINEKGEIIATTVQERSLKVTGLQLNSITEIIYKVYDESGEEAQSQTRNIIL